MLQYTKKKKKKIALIVNYSEIVILIYPHCPNSVVPIYYS